MKQPARRLPAPAQEDLLAQAEAAFREQKYAMAAGLSRRHIRLHGEDPNGHNLLGASLLRQGNKSQARVAFEAALRRDPDHVDALCNLGHWLNFHGDPVEGEAILRRAYALAPSRVMVQRELIMALSRRGHHDEVVELALRHEAMQRIPQTLELVLWAMLNTLRWEHLQPALREQFRAHLLVEGALPYIQSLTTVALFDEPQLLRQASRRHATAFQADRELGLAALGSPRPRRLSSVGRAISRPPTAAETSRRLRLGYLSAGFRAHVVGHLSVGLLEAHDRRHFEVIGYFASVSRGDVLEQRLRRACDHVREVAGLPTKLLADLIRQDRIDILIECDGATGTNRLDVLPLRPAPLQVHFLDYPGPTSAAGLDYAVLDRHVAPPGDENLVAEAVLALPGTYHPFDSRQPRPRIVSRTDLGWPTDAVVLGCMVQPFKLLPEMFDAYMRIVARLPRAVLALFCDAEPARAVLAARWAAAGLAPERLLLLRRVPFTAHLARLAQVDLLLDTWPYGSGASAMDALWCDVPLLALRGNTIASRNASAILVTHGLPELVCTQLGDFEAQAVRWGSDPVALRALKGRLAARRQISPLFDTELFTRGLESGLRLAWARHWAGLPPARIDVSVPAPTSTG